MPLCAVASFQALQKIAVDKLSAFISNKLNMTPPVTAPLPLEEDPSNEEEGDDDDDDDAIALYFSAFARVNLLLGLKLGKRHFTWQSVFYRTKFLAINICTR